MKNHKVLRAIWTFIGFCDLFIVIMNFHSKEAPLPIVLWSITGLLAFFLAYTYHLKVAKNKQD